MKMYDRVKIKAKGGMREFYGHTGTVVGEYGLADAKHKHLTKLYDADEVV